MVNTRPRETALMPAIVPIGTRTFPNLHLLDFRAEKTVRLASPKLAVRLEILNTLNINTVTSVTRQSGATFCQPTAIVPGRNVQVGFTYSF
jgi:hypothetical protein